MDGFKFSATVNADKIFLVNRSNVLERLDASYNYALANSNLKTNYPTASISSSFKSYSGGTPSKANASFWLGNIPWASPKDFKGFVLDKTEDFISKEAVDSSATTIAPVGALLMVVRSGVLLHTIPVAITQKPMAFNQDVKAFIPSSSISVQFLGIYFRIYNDQILPLIVKHSTTVQSINTAELNTFRIPVLPNQVQQKIVDLYTEATLKQQQKEQQAQALLDDIDGYLLNALGITLPVQDNRLEKRMFIVPFSELTGGRSDSDFYRKFYLESIKSLGTKFGAKSIKDLSINVFQGVGKDEVEFSEFTLLKVKNIKINNELDFSDTEFIASIPQQKILLENDIVSPFIGEAIKQYKFSNFSQTNGIYTVDNNTGVIRVNQDKCNPRYVCEVLNSAIGKFQIDRQIGGGGVPFLGASGAKKLLIPLPPIEKQNEIAAHISQIRAQAKQLQAEAANLLASAKTDIERMILGEVA